MRLHSSVRSTDLCYSIDIQKMKFLSLLQCSSEKLSFVILREKRKSGKFEEKTSERNLDGEKLKFSNIWLKLEIFVRQSILDGHLLFISLHFKRLTSWSRSKWENSPINSNPNRMENYFLKPYNVKFLPNDHGHGHEESISLTHEL